MIARLLLCLLALGLPANASYADAGLQFDPFSPQLPEEQRADPAQAPEAPPALNWSPQLLSTVVAGPRSMANVSGRIVRLGQKLEGFTLVAVDATSATFEKDGVTHVLTLKARQYTR